MPAKKKEPTLRWKKQPLSFFEFMRGTPPLKLQEWSTSQNKYVDVPVVE